LHRRVGEKVHRDGQQEGPRYRGPSCFRVSIGRGGLVRSVWPRPARLAFGVGEAVAVTVHLEDVDVMGETVEERAGEALGAEHGCPLVERQVFGWSDSTQGSSVLQWILQAGVRRGRRRGRRAARQTRIWAALSFVGRVRSAWQSPERRRCPDRRSQNLVEGRDRGFLVTPDRDQGPAR
jgi:hypothetical protein